jgi:hypothetical protein
VLCLKFIFSMPWYSVNIKYGIMRCVVLTPVQQDSEI